MSNESNINHSTANETSADLKGSDFFPPGAGWNHAPAKPEVRDAAERDAVEPRPDLGRH